MDCSLSVATLTDAKRLPRNASRSRSTSPRNFFSSADVANPTNTPSSSRAWTANYLTGLRSNRPARPNGSRPFPGKDKPIALTTVLEPTLKPSSPLAFSRPSSSAQQPDLTRPKEPERCLSAMSHCRAQSALPTTNGTESTGRPLARQPGPTIKVRDLTKSSMGTKASNGPNGGAYLERGQRWMERLEARSIREALEDMDALDEAHVSAAAQDEASELVWQHRNPGAPSRNHNRIRSCKQYLKNGSATLGFTQGAGTPSQRPVSDGSSSSKSRSTNSGGSRASSGASRGESKTSQEEGQSPAAEVHVLWDSPQKKACMNLSFPIPTPKPLGRRKVSEPKSRKLSVGLFSNPNDKIYEEPDAIPKEAGTVICEADPEPTPLKWKTRNSIAKRPSGTYGFLRSKTIPEVASTNLSKTDIYKNRPSQSHNASYVHNKATTNLPQPQIAGCNDRAIDTSRTKDGIEIRSDDIRAATSMRMKDRSPKLPSPTVVSDRPGRPIISFNKHWRPKEVEPNLEELSTAQTSTFDAPKPMSALLRRKLQAPLSTSSAPIVPTINTPDLPVIRIDAEPTTATAEEISVPSIELSPIPSLSNSCPQVPSIQISDDPPPSRKLPIAKPRGRPLPHHSSTAPITVTTSHWSPISPRSIAQCASCALPIAGRIVSVASQRFHPQCFTCYHCSELLECVAFYPEPSTSRDARFARIQNRTSDPEAPNFVDGHTAIDDGDTSLRFYCHLDFHELFSPRCRSCKTPIEGEVVIACGGEWHKGHFFCAECGDPFDEKTPFVEKNGYAWCVGCHAGRFNGKCKGCKKVILEQGIQALGGEWHEGCFRCVVRFFLSIGRLYAD